MISTIPLSALEGTDFVIVVDFDAPLPTSQVTVAISTSTIDLSVNVVELQFFTFESAQFVTVFVADDFVDDVDFNGEVTFTLSSLDGAYDGVVVNVPVTIVNDDTANVVVSEPGPLTVSEDGVTAVSSFTVVLESEPLNNVEVAVTSSDTTEVDVIPSTLTFTPANWNAPQTVSVAGVNDDVQDGDASTEITFLVSSSDPVYDAFPLDPISVTTQDDDIANVFADAGPLAVSEDGVTTATFTVVLESEPESDVTVTVTSSDTTEVTGSPTTLTFTAADWNVAQTVTLTGVDDDVDDGDASTEITFLVSSSDPVYDAFPLDPISVTTQDDDIANVFADAGPLAVSEDGVTTATFTVVLESEPESDVTVTVTSSDTTEVTGSPTTLTFTAADWNVAQTVTLTGVDDDVDDGDASTEITFLVSSSDVKYNAFPLDPISVTTQDDDTAGITVETPPTGLVVSEDGTLTSSFTVVLDSEPVAEVRVTIAVSGDEATVNPSELTFTSADWDTPQTVDVAGVDDLVDDGDQLDEITFVVLSSDSLYVAFPITPFNVLNVDDDDTGSSCPAATGGNSCPADRNTVKIIATVAGTLETFCISGWEAGDGDGDGAVDGPRTLTVTAPSSPLRTDLAKDPIEYDCTFGLVVPPNTFPADFKCIGVDLVNQISFQECVRFCHSSSLDTSCEIIKRDVDTPVVSSAATFLLASSGGGDPHLVSAEGLEFIFNGIANAVYALFTSPVVDINMQLAATGPKERYMTEMGIVFRGKNVTITPWFAHKKSELTAFFESLGATVEFSGWSMTIEFCNDHVATFAAMHTLHGAKINFLDVAI
ncbi:MAG: hypothetical protein IV100_23785, partial [Myxococcales bacterium]|nr:hypothetical protein [Myxococcales bacterium]